MVAYLEQLATETHLEAVMTPKGRFVIGFERIARRVEGCCQVDETRGTMAGYEQCCTLYRYEVGTAGRAVGGGVGSGTLASKPKRGESYAELPSKGWKVTDCELLSCDLVHTVPTVL